MPTNPALQKLPAPKLPKTHAQIQQIGVVRLPNGSFTKIGQVSPEIKKHTEDDYLCVVKIKDRHVLGYVYHHHGEYKVLPTSTVAEHWQGATFKQL